MAQKQIGIQVGHAVEALYIMWTREQPEVKAAQSPWGLTPSHQPQKSPTPPIVPTNQGISKYAYFKYDPVLGDI